ncbi:MAG: hypothetical protein AB1697_11865 [Pseudomonadota bacterium]
MKTLGLVFVALLALAGCETLQPRQVDVGVRSKDQTLRVIFSERDRALIHEYYAARAKPLPPGLAKKNKIPPGHAMQMERWGRLPPGIAYRALPGDLERRLSALPEGYARIVVGADIGILDTRTRVVVDVIKDIADDD